MIKSVWIFPPPDEMTVVFDDKGRQIPMLQGRWADVAEKVKVAIKRCNPEIHDAYGRL